MLWKPRHLHLILASSSNPGKLVIIKACTWCSLLVDSFNLISCFYSRKLLLPYLSFFQSTLVLLWFSSIFSVLWVKVINIPLDSWHWYWETLLGITYKNLKFIQFPQDKLVQPWKSNIVIKMLNLHIFTWIHRRGLPVSCEVLVVAPIVFRATSNIWAISYNRLVYIEIRTI